MISSSTKTDVLAGCREFLEMIKISHTLFAMPFAIGAAFLALRGMQVATQELAVLLGQIILAVALARTAAMSFNRWADRHIDAANPRTRDRSIPAGRLAASAVLLVSVLCVIGFVAVAASINPLALKLSPVVLIVILGYSWTKRFTILCHLVLGAGLAMAPLGAWVAIRGTLLSAADQVDTTPWILAGAVMLWTAGFDILYGCLDTDFDRAILGQEGVVGDDGHPIVRAQVLQILFKRVEHQVAVAGDGEEVVDEHQVADAGAAVDDTGSGRQNLAAFLRRAFDDLTEELGVGLASIDP